MTNRKILFRGFHPDENGKTAITLNGEKPKGEWVYGSHISLLQGDFIVTSNYYNDVIIELHERLECNALWEDNDFVKVIPETVGQWVTTDKNGKDVFEGDKFWLDGYSEAYIAQSLEQFYKGNYVSDEIELYRNKWESEVTE